MVISEKEFVDQLERKKILFDEMLALSERQLLLFGDKDLNEGDVVKVFELLIDERKTLIDLIDGIQAEINDFMEYSSNFELLERYQRQIGPIIVNIQNNDRQVMQMAQDNLRMLGNKLQATRDNKMAFQAYSGEIDTGGKGWFIDRKK